MSDIEELKRIGFVCAGKWLKSNKGLGLTYELVLELETANVVYALVFRDKVIYIGIAQAQSEKGKKGLSNRMGAYQSIASRGENSIDRKIHNFIRKNLYENSETTEIYALKPDNSIIGDYLGIEIDLVKGLENSLILHFKTHEKYEFNTRYVKNE